MYSEQKQALAETQALKRPAVLAVSGVHNSGKTTLLEKLLPVLRSRGLKVGVIKHDGHDFTPDVPGTDSYRLREAGAEGEMCIRDRRWRVLLLHQPRQDPAPSESGRRRQRPAVRHR